MLSDEDLSDLSSEDVKELAIDHAVCHQSVDKVTESDKLKGEKMKKNCHQNTEEAVLEKQESRISQGMSVTSARKNIHANKVKNLGDKILNKEVVKYNKRFEAGKRSFQIKKSANMKAAREICENEAKATSKS